VLKRLGQGAHDRRVVVLVIWLLALVGIGAASGAVGSGFTSEFSLPDVESADGFDVLESEFGGLNAGQTGTIVFEATQGVDDPAVVATMTEYFTAVAAIEDVTVRSPYSEEGATQVARQGPRAGEVAYASVEVPRDYSLEEALEVAEQMRELEPSLDGLNVQIGGQIFAEFEPPKSEIIGLAFAIVILILAFGSVLAMGLPIGTAIFGIGVGGALVTLLSQLVEMPDFTLTLGIMIGLGVGIDYALFIVTRFREERHRGRSNGESTGIAIDTAGRAVLFAGTTVVISLLGMLLMGVQFVNGLAIGAAVTVAVTMVASVTLLPALLGFAGDRVEVTRWRGVIAAGLVALALLGFGLGASVMLVAIPRLPWCSSRACSSDPSRPSCHGGSRSRSSRPCRTGGAGSSRPTRGRWRSAARSRCCCSRCRCSACASGSPTRGTTPRTPRPARRTTSSPRASAPASTARSWWSPSCPRAPTRPCWNA
jgi:putative drug exporter of the RND superfamily